MGPSSCVGTLGPIDHSPYTVPTLYRDPGPPRSSLQPIVGLAKGDRLETPNNTVRIDTGMGGVFGEKRAFPGVSWVIVVISMLVVIVVVLVVMLNKNGVSEILTDSVSDCLSVCPLA